MIYNVTQQQKKKTFHLKILCLKFVQFYISFKFETQNITRIKKKKVQQKIKVCP